MSISEDANLFWRISPFELHNTDLPKNPADVVIIYVRDLEVTIICLGCTERRPSQHQLPGCGIRCQTTRSK